MYSLILKLAYKNAFLRLTRTLLVVIMIAVSMSMMLTLEGLYDGMTLSMVDKNKRSDSGEVSIYAKNYRISKSLKDNIADATKIQKELLTNKNIRAVALRLKAEGLSATARKSAFSTIIGINLNEEERFGKLSDFLMKGKIELKHHGVLVGSELAKRLKLKIGSKLIFSTQDSSGEINAIALRVKGIIQSGNVILDKTALYIDREKLRAFLGLPQDVATQIAIRSGDKNLKTLLAKKYKNLDVKSFLELYPMMQEMQDIMKVFQSVIFSVVMLVVFIGIMGVMYVSILDRIREFGILRSIGMPYKSIRMQIFLEALFVGMMGYSIGATLGFISLKYLEIYGLNLSEFADGLEAFGYSSIMYADIKMSYFTSTFIAILLSSILSVLLPLRKIKNMNTIDVTKVEI